MLILHQIGPGVSLQDFGRPGLLATGVSRGGAADPRALHEAHALLGQAGAALEMAGMGGLFEVTVPARIALTGAPMQAELEGRPLEWHASHRVQPGERLRIGGMRSGVYGYLSVGGGIAVPPIMGSQARHQTARIGPELRAGQSLPLGKDPGGETGSRLAVSDRFSGGDIRVVDTAQTDLFAAEVHEKFHACTFRRGRRGNRQGIEVDIGADRFPAEGGLTILSELITPGDIQMTGDGVPFVLLAECQTTGGYPRIASVIPPDLPKVAQAGPGAKLRFQRVTRAAAIEAMRRDQVEIAGLRSKVEPLLRDVSQINLLAHNLISGVISDGTEPL